MFFFLFISAIYLVECACVCLDTLLFVKGVFNGLMTIVVLWKIIVY